MAKLPNESPSPPVVTIMGSNSIKKGSSMPQLYATKSAVINAPPHAVYAIIADYKSGHPRILPQRYFSHLEVEQGGVGDGTVIRFQMRVFGTTQTLNAKITEPVPGEVLLETIAETGARTSFQVLPKDNGQSSCVTITTEWHAKGIAGWIQGWLIPPLLRKIYTEELDNLARIARG